MKIDHFSMIKGRLGETIVELLFRELGFKVFKYGVENTLPEITHMMEKNNSQDSVLKQVRKQPDMIVFKENEGWKLIEVKYRTDGYIEASTLLYYEDDNILYFLISPNKFGIISHNELRNYSRNSFIKFEDLPCLKDSQHFTFSDDEKDVIRRSIKLSSTLFNRLPKIEEMNKILEN